MKMPQLSARTRSKINTDCDSWGGARGVNLALPPCKRPHFQRGFSCWANVPSRRPSRDPKVGKALRILLSRRNGLAKHARAKT